MLAQLTERRRRIEDGEVSLGWKLGMGVPAAMAKLGTDAPLVSLGQHKPDCFISESIFARQLIASRRKLHITNEGVTWIRETQR